MGRAIARWTLGVLGVIAILGGATVAGASAWVRAELGSDDSLRSASQQIDATGCRALLVEIASANLAAGEVPDTSIVGIDSQSQLAITPAGSASSWLVGLADGSQVSDRLLGTRYCVATASQGAWSLQDVTVRPEDPALTFAGLQGRWAKAGNGESVIVPIPEPGQTLVVAAEGDGAATSIELAGIYRLPGAYEMATISLIGGLITSGVGIVVLIISIVALRQRGRHEGRGSGGAQQPTAEPS